MKLQMPRRSDYDLDERAAEATFILNHPMLREAFDELRKRYIDEITASLAGSNELISAHARVRVLHEVEAHIKSIINDKKLADKKGMRYE